MTTLTKPKTAAITLTEAAAHQIKHLAAGLTDKESMLRIWVHEGGCSGLKYGIGFDKSSPEDIIATSHGITFAIDPDSLVYLDGCVINFDGGFQGKGFEVNNPNARSSCGCGKSFQ